MKRFHFKTTTLAALAAFGFLSLGSIPTFAMGAKPKMSDVKEVAASSTASLRDFNRSADRPSQKILDQAACLVSIANNVQGGFILGGSFGRGLVTCRTKNGRWSRPSYYSLNVGSAGLQAGFKVSDILMVFIGPQSQSILHNSTIKLGGNMNVIAGYRELGQNFRNQGTTVVTYTRDRGLMANLSLSGAVLKSRPRWNKVAYGAEPQIDQDSLLQVSGYLPAFLEPFMEQVDYATDY